MKNLATIKILILLLMCWFFSCVNKSKRYDYKTILKVEPQHDTRVYITYISVDDDTITSSVHCSKIIKANNTTFKVNDYLNGKLKYGTVK